MSFGGRLAQLRETQAWDSTRRARSSAEEFDFARMRPGRPRALNALPLPARAFRAGRGRGEWGQAVFGKVFRKGFLPSTEL